MQRSVQPSVASGFVLIAREKGQTMEYSKHAQDKLQTPVDGTKEPPDPEVDPSRVPDPSKVKIPEQDELEDEKAEKQREKDKAKRKDPDHEDTSQFNTD
ncbi:hypothetical protein [Glutamicibacter sp.]|uniref:hypothetical protein n=1 Tax=Glutamicibacter sp. TaxID=1931995 RepID=UPI0028BE1D9D|nr:hypothetical protein [Glutamicibacter sp.]